jgi:hypothetical protein
MALGWQEPKHRSLPDQPISEETLMSTSAISASSLNQQIQQYFHTRQTDLQDLGKALGTGDLAGAQAAFQAIAQLGQGGPFANGDPFANSQREQDFTAIGNALQSGDLTGAQQAFSDLKATFGKNSGGSQPPVTDPILTSVPPSTAGPEIVLNLSSSSTNPEQITINLNPTAGGGEQVSLSIGQQGSKPQEITLNLAPNSNEEIILNLLGASSPTGTTSSTSAGGGGLSVSA